MIAEFSSSMRWPKISRFFDSVGFPTPGVRVCTRHTPPEDTRESATKTNGVTESNIADDAYQQGVQNACIDSIVAISILKIVFRV